MKSAIPESEFRSRKVASILVLGLHGCPEEIVIVIVVIIIIIIIIIMIIIIIITVLGGVARGA